MSTYKLYGQMCGFNITNTFLLYKVYKSFQTNVKDKDIRNLFCRMFRSLEGLAHFSSKIPKKK